MRKRPSTAPLPQSAPDEDPTGEFDNTTMRLDRAWAAEDGHGRPPWLTGDCPPWCEMWNYHRPDDAPPSDDRPIYNTRVHWRAVGRIERTTEQFHAPDQPPVVDVVLAQGYREIEPRIMLLATAADGERPIAWADAVAVLCFTPAEADQLAELVARAATWAREGAGAVTL